MILTDGLLKFCNDALPCTGDFPILPVSNDVSNLFLPMLTEPFKTLIGLKVSMGLKETPENVTLPCKSRSAMDSAVPLPVSANCMLPTG
ncbi:MAG: hypothetical protein BWX99_02936 [Deltaproteobacteria bacterium ADurb.Bin151]|nr:MAG: hypothetical protein BWX99_02936 [Deltaproteobacteria bacterium ADurb.Bin151]